MQLDSDLSGDQARWACDMLGVDGAASAEALRRASFEAVANAEFAPDRAKREAIDLARFGCVFRPETSCPAWSASAGKALVADVERFAQQFFLVPPDLRSARWRELSRKAELFPAAAARLAMLRPGLDVPCEPPSNADEETRELMRKLMWLFVVPPTKRSEALRETGLFTRAIRTQRAAKTILQRHADWKPLDPATLERLAGNDVVKSRRPAAAMSPVVAQSSDNGNKGWTPAIIAIWVVGILIRLASSGGSSSSPSSPPRHVAPPPSLSEDLWRDSWRQRGKAEPAKPGDNPLIETSKAPRSVDEVLKKLLEQAEMQRQRDRARQRPKNDDAGDSVKERDAKPGGKTEDSPREPESPP